jgi:hypothetical protein
MIHSLPRERLPFAVTHTLRLLRSFQRWTGRPLLSDAGPDGDPPDALAERLYHHPAVVLSHGTEADPMLNYGNEAALRLWETTWEALTMTPSRLTAEPVAQDERARLLAEAGKRGYLENYQGIRISLTGRRFLIEGATVWTVLDERDRIVGQAATFERWTSVS